MQFHDVEQNTEEWLDLKIAKLSGSKISCVMANYGKAFGDPAKRLAVSIAREQVTGKRSLAEQYSNAHMERGHEQEPIARMLYEEETFTDVLNGGFFDCGREGCSPDGRVGEVGLIEIKSVIDHVHYANIKRGGVDPAYKWQTIFNVDRSQREWIDFVSYCADFPEQTRLYIHRIYREECEKEIAMINERVGEFFEMVNQMKRVITGETA